MFEMRFHLEHSLQDDHTEVLNKSLQILLDFYIPMHTLLQT